MALHDAAVVLVGEVAGVGVVAGLLEVPGRRCGGMPSPWNLKAVQPHFSALASGHLVAPDGGVFDVAGRDLQWCDRSGRGRGNGRPAGCRRGFRGCGRRDPRARSRCRWRPLTVTPRDGAGAGALHQHLGIELVDVERILADDDALHFVEDQVLDAPAPVGLADAVEPGIGFDLDQIPVPGAADDHALDVRDFDLVADRRDGARKWPRRKITGRAGGKKKLASIHVDSNWKLKIVRAARWRTGRPDAVCRLAGHEKRWPAPAN